MQFVVKIEERGPTSPKQRQRFSVASLHCRYTVVCIVDTAVRPGRCQQSRGSTDREEVRLSSSSGRIWPSPLPVTWSPVRSSSRFFASCDRGIRASYSLRCGVLFLISSAGGRFCFMSWPDFFFASALCSPCLPPRCSTTWHVSIHSFTPSKRVMPILPLLLLPVRRCLTAEVRVSLVSKHPAGPRITSSLGLLPWKRRRLLHFQPRRAPQAAACNRTPRPRRVLSRLARSSAPSRPILWCRKRRRECKTGGCEMTPALSVMLLSG